MMIVAMHPVHAQENVQTLYSAHHCSSLMRLRTMGGETNAAVIGLTSTYHNLLRVWGDT